MHCSVKSVLITWLCMIPAGYLEKAQSIPVQEIIKKMDGEPVWSHAESTAAASASGGETFVNTISWTDVNNDGGLQVNEITSNGTVLGYYVSGLTNCSQLSSANATGSHTATADVQGLCESGVLLNQQVSNTGTNYVNATSG